MNIYTKFTWNQILILYVLIGTIVCNILPIPELAKGAIAINRNKSNK